MRPSFILAGEAAGECNDGLIDFGMRGQRSQQGLERARVQIGIHQHRIPKARARIAVHFTLGDRHRKYFTAPPVEHMA